VAGQRVQPVVVVPQFLRELCQRQVRTGGGPRGGDRQGQRQPGAPRDDLVDGLRLGRGPPGTEAVIARWNGSAWSRETPPTNGSLIDAAAVGPSTVWAAGYLLNGNNNGQTLAVRTTNG